MLRRDMDYVFTWNEQEGTWVARPAELRDGAVVVVGTTGKRMRVFGDVVYAE